MARTWLIMWQLASFCFQKSFHLAFPDDHFSTFYTKAVWANRIIIGLIGLPVSKTALVASRQIGPGTV